MKEYMLIGREVAVLWDSGEEVFGEILAIKDGTRPCRELRRAIIGNNSRGPFATVMLSGLAGSPTGNWRFVS